MAEYSDTEKEVRKLEQKWQELKAEYDRSQMLLEKAREETDSPKNHRNGKATTLKETLAMQLREQENIYGRLKNVNFNPLSPIYVY